jgi:hypothetical protein
VAGADVRQGQLRGRLDGKRPLQNFRHRSEDNIKMGGKETGSKVLHWIHLA